MTKKKARLHGNKGKRWKKGSSSSSNPEKKTFRQQARANAINFEPAKPGPSHLTFEAVKKHTLATTNQDIEPDDDVRSDSGHTFSTWASNYTQCTNKSFNKVLRYTESTSGLHKDIVAVLAAVTEVIRLREGKESDTEYFCALMTALDSAEDHQTITAIVYLLSLSVNKVPHSILQRRCPELSQRFAELLGTHAAEGSAALLKSLLFCLATVLRHQENPVWSIPSTHNMFNLILHFLDHDKPKVRKAAHHACCAVVRGSPMMQQPQRPETHPAAKLAAQFAIKQIEQHGGLGTAKETLHSLGLLRDVMPLLPTAVLRKSAETVLRVMTLANPVVRSTCLRALHGLFSAEPDQQNLPGPLNAQIISALYDFQPSENDIQATQAWLSTLQKAHTNLARVDEVLCLGHLPRLFKTCMQCLSAGRKEACCTAANVMQELLAEVLGPAAAGDSPITDPLTQVLTSLRAGLSYQFHTVWGLVLKTLAAFFQHVSEHCPAMSLKVLTELAELRDTQSFAFGAELDAAVGRAVQSLGPKLVLQAVPLNLSVDNAGEQLGRSWLIPVLRDNIRTAHLAYFTRHFLPLATQLRSKWQQLREKQQLGEAKMCEVLQAQLWSLLPAFCSSPPDVATAFTPDLAKLLATALEQYTDIRLTALTSLRRLISHSLGDDTAKERVSSYVKNYMPKLFNLYTSTASGAEDKVKQPWRGAVLETVRSFLSVTSQPMLENFITHALSLIANEETAAPKRVALCDLLIVMTPQCETEEALVRVVTAFSSYFESSDRSLQKKAYRLLEEICMSSQQCCRKYVTQQLSELQELLVTALAASSPSAKAPRLRCLIHILRQLEEAHWAFVSVVLPEAVLCVRETAEKARGAAYKLLLELGAACVRWKGSTSEGVLQLFQLLSAGYGGSPQFVASTALAVTRLTYEYREELSAELVLELLSQTCLLMRNAAREVVQAALGLAQLLLRLLSEQQLAPHLEQMVEALVVMREENGLHFRFKTKDLFKRLIRKFGYETVHHLVPESHSKMLSNLRKTEAREKRKREARKAAREHSDDSGDELLPSSQPESFEEIVGGDSDLEDEAAHKRTENGGRKRRKAAEGALLQEDDEAVDFMDPSAAKHVVAKSKGKGNVQKNSSSPEDSGFKMAGDGRLIITETPDEQEERGTKRRMEDSDDDLEELLAAMDGHKKNKRARRSAPDSDDSDGENRSRYEPGGRGIHRSLKEEKSNQPAAGQQYKAKKASGDVKKKGKVDPYAYVPLQHSSLNRRKKTKLKGQFKGLIGAARAGAAKGGKIKAKGSGMKLKRKK